MEDVDGPGAEEVVREAPDAEDGLGEVGGAGGELLRVCVCVCFFFSGIFVSFVRSESATSFLCFVFFSSSSLRFLSSLSLSPKTIRRTEAAAAGALPEASRAAARTRRRGSRRFIFFFFWLSSLMGVRCGGKTKSELQTLETLFLLFTFLFGSLTSSPHLLCPSPPRLNRPSPRSSRWSERSPCSSRPRTRSKEPPKEGGRPTLVRYSDRERLLAINETV